MKKSTIITVITCTTLLLAFSTYRLSKPTITISFLKSKSTDTIFYFEITNNNPFPISISTHGDQKQLRGYLLLKEGNTYHFSKSCGTHSPNSKKLSPFETEEFYIESYEPENFSKIGIYAHSPSTFLQFAYEKLLVKNKENLPKAFNISKKLEL